MTTKQKIRFIIYFIIALGGAAFVLIGKYAYLDYVGYTACSAIGFMLMFFANIMCILETFL